MMKVNIQIDDWSSTRSYLSNNRRIKFNPTHTNAYIVKPYQGSELHSSDCQCQT